MTDTMKLVEELQDEYNACKDDERRKALVKEINTLLFAAETIEYGHE